MWNHLIQMMKARRALRSGRFEAALAHLEDRLIRDDRRALDLRRKILSKILERARKRMMAGHLDLADKDLDRLLALEPDHQDALDFAKELALRHEELQERSLKKTVLLESFEHAFDGGRLAEAREALKEVQAFLEAADFAKLETRLKERRLAASRVLSKVRRELDSGQKSEAKRSLEKARRLCSDSIAFRDRLVGLSAAWAKERLAEVHQSLTRGEPLDAARALAQWWDSDPESENIAEARDLLLCVADRLATDARELAEKGSFSQALVLACRAPGVVVGVPVLRRLKDVLDRVDMCLRGDDEDPRKRLEVLNRLGAETRWASLRPHLEEFRKAAARVDSSLKEARTLLTKGQTVAGKQSLAEVLDRWPGCEEAKSLLSGLLQNEEERGQRLDAARTAFREGRLIEAERHLLGLIGGGFASETARSLMRDVERLRSKVLRELTAIEARLDAGDDLVELEEGLRRLQRTQNDAHELQDLQARVQRRRSRGEREQKIRAALQRADSRSCLDAIRDWIAEGGESALREEERRALENIGKECEEALKEALAAGDPAYVSELASGLLTWQERLGIRVDGVLETAAARCEEARELAGQGLMLIEEKQLSAAESVCERARALSPSEPVVLRLLHRIRRIQQDMKGVQEALELASVDRDGAKTRLSQIGPTPRPLGSMVFALKERIERSGDLEGGCILRVDEAGDFLLFTGDRLRVGSVQGRGFPQIPVLARIKAQHATFSREVSFHGGVKDRILAEAGAKLEVNGKLCDEAALAHGKRVVLGGILPFLYLKPSPRSASALLRIERGFESRGVSRILWVKQGGKDGRIFIGRGREVHIRVPSTEPELFIYAPGPGRLRIFFDGTGEIDGKEFRGEAELQAGCSVSCASISFRILPL